MSELNTILFFYGFRKCNDNEKINFKKLNDKEYLVFRTFSKGRITDLLIETYDKSSNPCNSFPLSDKVIKQGFNPKEDSKILDEYLDK